MREVQSCSHRSQAPAGVVQLQLGGVGRDAFLRSNLGFGSPVRSSSSRVSSAAASWPVLGISGGGPMAERLEWFWGRGLTNP